MRSVTAILALLIILLPALAHSLVTPELAAIKDVHRAEFWSCPGCRLNHQPELRRFLKDRIEAGTVEGVSVKYIPGHVPELLLFDKEDKQSLLPHCRHIDQIGGLSVDHQSVEEVSNLLEELGF